MAEMIVALPGDGIGEEVVAEAVRVLERCADHNGIAVDIERLPIGGKAIDEYGEPLPEFVL
ncbi:MAG TPA: isocitrate/isopropylmalate family dehydrogenase, partial [Acidobacteriota bacterium]|nr:isocitrate/isopropylmalate family dehydrogenase [Acidobacteriota bacterium]